MENVKITYEGQTTEVELKPCSQCGKMPTAEDAEKAVEHERKTARVCAICGVKPPMYPKHALYHSVDCSGKGGFILSGTGTVDTDWDPQWVNLYTSGPSWFVDYPFHLKCLQKVAPGIVIQKR